MRKFETIGSTIAVLAIDNIDTDQIIGSDFLKITNKEGLGKHLFSDWRYDTNGKESADFVLNQPLTAISKILIVGDNFACGSSREHAPWALLDFGIRVVISTSIADIFYNNAIKNGLLPIIVSAEQHQILLQQNANSIVIDLQNQKIKTEFSTYSFDIDPFVKYCLLNGIDQLDFLLNQTQKIDIFEKNKQESTYAF